MFYINGFEIACVKCMVNIEDSREQVLIGSSYIINIFAFLKKTKSSMTWPSVSAQYHLRRPSQQVIISHNIPFMLKPSKWQKIHIFHKLNGKWYPTHTHVVYQWVSVAWFSIVAAQLEGIWWMRILLLSVVETSSLSILTQTGWNATTLHEKRATNLWILQ